MKIAVDAMGGDQAPKVVVQGAVKAARELDLSIVLVGDQAKLEQELSEAEAAPGLVDIHHCSQVAGMAEAPIDVLRHKKDSSIRVAFDLVKAGEADAVVSAGNSGATLAVGTVVLGRMPRVERPGIAGVFPTVRGNTVVMDIGANVDCKPSYLYQFGVMAEAYAREALHIKEPRVGLLSIGEEDSKGNELVLKAHDLLRAGSLNFIGNVEGRDVFTGTVDVIVCDGFVGNVVLKLAEGMAEAFGGMLKDELKASFWSRLGSWLALGAFKRFKRKMDYAEFGGAPLLGVKGVGLISHGRSTDEAMKNAIRTAAAIVEAKLTERLEQRLKETAPPKEAPTV